MNTYRADWVLPIVAEPLRDGWFAVESGNIAGLGPSPPVGARDLGRVAVLPALVNAHTHLDLTHIGPQPYNADGGFVGWVELIRSGRAPDEAQVARSVRLGV